jgi:hypothetical protein
MEVIWYDKILIEEQMPERMIYTMGNLPTEVRDQLGELLSAFHRDRSVQSELYMYLKTAHRHLDWETDSTGIFGIPTRYFGIPKLIPKGTRFGYYSGALTIASPHANSTSSQQALLGLSLLTYA